VAGNGFTSFTMMLTLVARYKIGTVVSVLFVDCGLLFLVGHLVTFLGKKSSLLCKLLSNIIISLFSCPVTLHTS